MSSMTDGPSASANLPARIEPRLQSLSQILRGLLQTDAERIYVGDVVDAFGPRAFGALLFAFSLLSLIAAVPGSSAVTAVPLLIIAAQLVIGAPNLWLPKMLDRRSLKREDLTRMMDRVLPMLERIERFLTPRWSFMFGAVGDRLIGLTCLLLAIVLALPIPFFNLAPGAGIAALALGLAARDGLVVLIGYGITSGCVVVLVLSANVVVAAVQRIMHLFGV
jgi:hypothetical protein